MKSFTASSSPSTSISTAPERKITHRPRDRKSRSKTHDRIAKTDSLHATVQLENDAPYALTSARAPFAARNSIPLSPE